MLKYKLELYVDLKSPISYLAKRNLESILELLPKENYELTVVDIRENPEICEEKKLMTLPTLIKVAPGPEQRFVGSLEDKGPLANALGVFEKSKPTAVGRKKHRAVTLRGQGPTRREAKNMRDTIIERRRKWVL